ncbi:hypothetical protein [Candidatus Epulonipiscium viviparus]|uniref:hypothetical protein n=1 Tax=Candidatus Epulonipiscium viviparus TaxID=420336 RepID=UPI00016C0B5C|nr:hypothetical protein [Candidatus Epulopiscium viviparus]
MGLETVLMQFILIIFFVGIINSLIGFFKLRKVLKDNQNNPNVTGIAIVNGKIEVIEKETMPKNESIQVKAYCCNKLINKEDAYRLFVGGTEYYFCSWECEEKFKKTLSNL